MENIEIEILTNESKSLKSDIKLLIKNIHNCLFSSIAFLGLFVGVLFNLREKNGEVNSFEGGLLAFLISQIEFIIIIYIINTLSDVIYKAAYISYIENRINHIVGKKTIFWESKLIPHLRKSNAFILSQVTLSFSYVLVFAGLTIYGFNKVPYCLYWIQIIEVLITGILIMYLFKEPSRAQKVIKVISASE